jgi:hypothetical protein
MLSKARRTESSLATFVIPGNSGFTPSPRMAWMWAYRPCPASTDSRIVPSTSRLRGAFGLLYSRGQSSTQASNRPLVFRNSMKKGISPKLLTAPSGSHFICIFQRTYPHS